MVIESSDYMKISVGVSNRHVHLTEEHFKTLFGEISLEKDFDLHQKGDFASKLFVTIKGPKGSIDKVRVVGPIRTYTQVEVSITDSYTLGINPPIRKSGDISSSSPITIIGPNSTLELKDGAIIAERHIHVTKEQLAYYKLDENKPLNILVQGEKPTILNNVKLKVSDNAYFELHLDTDDANACNLRNGDIVDIL